MSMCLDKLRYADKVIAVKVAQEYTVQSHRKGSNTRLNGKSYGKGKNFRVYLCPICKGYHLTTKPKRRDKV